MSRSKSYLNPVIDSTSILNLSAKFLSAMIIPILCTLSPLKLPVFLSISSNTQRYNSVNCNYSYYNLRYFWVYWWVVSHNRHVHFVKGDVYFCPFCWSNEHEFVIFARVRFFRGHQGRIFSVISTNLQKKTLKLL